MSALELQPSGLAMLPAGVGGGDDSAPRLLTPSVFSVLQTSLLGGTISVHVPVPGMDLEDLQVVRHVNINGEPAEGSTLVRAVASCCRHGGVVECGFLSGDSPARFFRNVYPRR
jgi:hypothetical protein